MFTLRIGGLSRAATPRVLQVARRTGAWAGASHPPIARFLPAEPHLARQRRRSARSVFALDESVSPCPLSRPPTTAVPVVPAPRGVCSRGRARGSRSAVDVLFARYGSWLRRWARGRLPAWARATVDTSDLVQDTLHHTFARLGELQVETNPRVADLPAPRRREPDPGRVAAGDSSPGHHRGDRAGCGLGRRRRRSIGSCSTMRPGGVISTASSGCRPATGG